MTAVDHEPRATRAPPQLVSVVMPVLDAEVHIGAQLAALAAQGYDAPWELLVVDNGCSDRSLATVESCRAQLPPLTIVDARHKRGINRARTAGVAAAHGDFVAFCDADDVVAPGWLSALARAAAGADLVGGRLELEALNDPVRQAWNGGAVPTMTELECGYGFLPYVPGGNCGMWTHVAREIGWDESFTFGAADVEFGWRASRAGFKATFQPDAVVNVRYRTGIAALMRQYFRYGASEPQLYRWFRAGGMPRRSLREAQSTWIWLVRQVPRAVHSREVRGNWLRVAAASCGRLWGSARWRVLYP